MAAECILCCSFCLCGLLLIVEYFEHHKVNDTWTSVLEKTGMKYRKLKNEDFELLTFVGEILMLLDKMYSLSLPDILIMKGVVLCCRIESNRKLDNPPHLLR